MPKLIAFPENRPTQYTAIEDGHSLYTLIKIKEEWKLINVNYPLTIKQIKEIKENIIKLNGGELL